MNEEKETVKQQVKRQVKRQEQETQIARICAKLQRKLIIKGKWRPSDRKRWDLVIEKLKEIRCKK